MKANWIRFLVVSLTLLALGSFGVSRHHYAVAQSTSGSGGGGGGGCCGGEEDGSKYCGSDTQWNGSQCVPKKKTNTSGTRGF